MNIESRTDRAKELRTQTIRGEINPPEIISFLKDLYHSTEFDPTLHSLWDATDAVFRDVTTAEIRVLANFVRVNWAEKYPPKTAIVISGDYHFGLSRMFEQFIGPSGHGKIRTFRDLPGATDWIQGKGSAAPQPSIG